MHDILAVEHHQQDTGYYCGAACAQMVLAGIGAGILDQVGLYNDNNAHSTTEGGWYSAPDGLTWTMNDRRPPGFTNPFVLFALATEDLISRKIVWTIHHYRVAPIALVYGSMHWIVVHGYDASAAPSAHDDTSYTINAFDVNNPAPPTPSGAAEPPHTAGDDCGSGGDRAIANEHVSYATWQSTYMTGVGGGHWGGTFVAVCDPDPPPVRHGERQTPHHRASGERLLAPAEAVQYARAALDEFGLYERESWARVLNAAEPAEPVLVERLDRPGAFYYTVPMQRVEDAAQVAAVSIDARYGDYLQTSRIAPQKHLLRTLTPRVAMRRATREPVELPGRRGHIQVERRHACVYPNLVWRPCLESLSPNYPFRMVVAGGHRLYVRSDGRVFSRLTFGRGV